MAAYNPVSDALEDAWGELNPQWTAEAKRKYYNTVFDALLSEAAGIYQRNEALDRYAQSVAGTSEEQQEAGS